MMTKQENIEELNSLLKLGPLTGLSPQTLEAIKEAAIAYEEQEPILDKIKAEIMQLYNEVEVVDYDHNDVSRIKKAHWIIREEVLWIIDKYKKKARFENKE